MRIDPINQRSLTLSQSQQNIDELENEDLTVTDQLSREIEVLRDLQNDMNTGTQSLDTRQILMKSAELDYQFQKARLDELQARYQAEQTSLHQVESGR